MHRGCTHEAEEESEEVLGDGAAKGRRAHRKQRPLLQPRSRVLVAYIITVVKTKESLYGGAIDRGRTLIR